MLFFMAMNVVITNVAMPIELIFGVYRDAYHYRYQ